MIPVNISFWQASDGGFFKINLSEAPKCSQIKYPDL